MNRVFIDQSGFEYIRYLSAEPRMKYVDGEATNEQDRDENGTPLFGIVCLAKQKGATKPETITVKVGGTCLQQRQSCPTRFLGRKDG